MEEMSRLGRPRLVERYRGRDTGTRFMPRSMAEVRSRGDGPGVRQRALISPRRWVPHDRAKGSEIDSARPPRLHLHPQLISAATSYEMYRCWVRSWSEEGRAMGSTVACLPVLASAGRPSCSRRHLQGPGAMPWCTRCRIPLPSPRTCARGRMATPASWRSRRPMHDVRQCRQGEVRGAFGSCGPMRLACSTGVSTHEHERVTVVPSDARAEPSPAPDRRLQVPGLDHLRRRQPHRSRRARSAAVSPAAIGNLMTSA